MAKKAKKATKKKAKKKKFNFRLSTSVGIATLGVTYQFGGWTHPAALSLLHSHFES